MYWYYQEQYPKDGRFFRLEREYFYRKDGDRVGTVFDGYLVFIGLLKLSFLPLKRGL